ncbi:fatty acid hydroxylase family protein [Clostridiales bacterium oral taxon 876 str. F0540]|nr:fatty acid hydroxylase family protein [Clostridiales bacterium oral taxon 876 str. F0540]
MLLLVIVILAFLYASLVEYCLHRFVQHRTYEIDHIKNHHRLFHGVKSYQIKEAKSEDILLDAKGILTNIVLYVIPSAVLFMQSKIYGILFLIVCLIYNVWEECVHFYSHKITNTFLEQNRLFKRLKEHHRVHHYIYNSNYGIGSTIWDIVFRTKKLADRRWEERIISLMKDEK